MEIESFKRQKKNETNKTMDETRTVSCRGDIQ